MNKYQIGTSVEVKATFRDLTGALFDPNPVVCIIRQPNATETPYTYGDDAELVRDSIGSYHLWVLADQTGYYHYRYKGGAAPSVANESRFYADASAFSTP